MVLIITDLVPLLGCFHDVVHIRPLLLPFFVSIVIVKVLSKSHVAFRVILAILGGHFTNLLALKLVVSYAYLCSVSK